MQKSNSTESLVRGGLLVQSAGLGVREDAQLFIKNGVIKAIGKDAEKLTGSGTEILDFHGKIIAPGLVDSHVHLIWSGKKNALFDAIDKDHAQLTAQVKINMRAALSHGITTVRDCGGIARVMLPLAGTDDLLGPRLVSCGAPVTTTGGHCGFLENQAKGVNNVRRAVRYMADSGAQFIKVMVTGGGSTPGTEPRASQYSGPELETMAGTAHDEGLTIAGHVHGTEGIELAVSAGFDSLEHCSWLARNGTGIDYRDDIVESIINNKIFVCKTIAGFERWTLEELGPDHAAWKTLHPMRTMVDAGVRFIAGTDAGIDHTNFEGLSITMETMVGAGGMSHRAAFASATETAAEALGLSSRIGSLETGKIADCIILDSDPLEDVRSLRNVRAVLRNGRVVVREGRIC